MFNEARHYFVCGNTAQGFVNKLPSNLQGLEQVFVLRGRPGTGKACLMSHIAAACEKTGRPAEYLHCPSAPDTYDGMIVPSLKLAVIDATDIHLSELNLSLPAGRAFPSVTYIETDALFDREKLRQADETAASLVRQLLLFHENAFQYFGGALSVHDEWERIYISNMDFVKADLLTAYTEAMLLGGRRLDKAPLIKERFFGASTPSGAMDYIENLTKGISKRYLLKGRPGTGKSTLLRKLAAASAERGLDTEIYSCAFDSGSLDMLLWPELDRCLFDSTAPHLYEPTRPNDEVIDMYAGCVRLGTDEEFAGALEDITERYREAIRQGTAALSEAKRALDSLLDLYRGLTDPEKIGAVCIGITGQLH